MTFVQRFGDALNLNLHFHTLAIDGVFQRDHRGSVNFLPLPPLEDSEVARVTRRVARRVERLLISRGLGADADPAQADPLPDEQPRLAEIAQASVQGRAAEGPRAGKALERRGDQIDPHTLDDQARHRELPSLCAAVSGFNVHAAVCVPARDRRRLERLCRYAGRPPVSTERLSRLDDGRLSYQLKHRWRDGTTHVVFDPLDFISKLAALVPPPRFHLVRYHGVLAPCASERDRVVPAPPRRPPANDGCSHPSRTISASGSPHAGISVAVPCTDQPGVVTAASTTPALAERFEPDRSAHPDAAHSEPSDRQHTR